MLLVRELFQDPLFLCLPNIWCLVSLHSTDRLLNSNNPLVLPDLQPFLKELILLRLQVLIDLIYLLVWHLLIYLLALMHLDLLDYLIGHVSLELLLQLFLLCGQVLLLVVGLLQKLVALCTLLFRILYHSLHSIAKLIFMLTSNLVLGQNRDTDETLLEGLIFQVVNCCLSLSLDGVSKKFHQIIWFFYEHWYDTMLERETNKFLQIHILLVVVKPVQLVLSCIKLIEVAKRFIVLIEDFNYV